MKEKLEIMSTELSIYKERFNDIKTSDKKLIIYYFMYILHRFLLYGMNIFIYGIIFRDMGDFECYIEDFEYYMGNFE